MAQIPFSRHSYQSRALSLSVQRLVNMYAEQAPEDAASPLVLYNTPGLSEFASGLKQPTRGVQVMASVLYVVGGDTLYSVDSSGTETDLGQLNTGRGPVGMEINQASLQQLAIVDGTDGWIYDTSNGLVKITDGDFQTADVVDYQDGYFLFNKQNSDQWFISNLNDGTSYTGTDIATVEADPDLLVTLASVNRKVWLLGETSTEVWFNSGNADFPFERQNYFPVGCAARWSVGKLIGGLIWLARRQDGGGPFVAGTLGGNVERLSTHPIERALQGYETIDDAEAFTYTQSGHQFYVLTFPTASATWVYDLTTQLWHERESYQENGRWRARWHAFAYDKHIVGDYESGRLGEMDEDTFEEYGEPLTFLITGGPQYADRKMVFFKRLELFFETGVGLTTGQGSDPVVWLDYSDDGGHTWSAAEPARDIGKIGAYQERVYWGRLGQSRSRVFRVRGSDPVKRSLISAHLEASVGAH